MVDFGTIIIIVFTILFPVLGSFFAVFKYFSKSKKCKILYSAILGILIGTMAFYFNPAEDFDLVRHQQVVRDYQNTDISDFFENTGRHELELLPQFISFLISRTNNVDLLQFFIISIGYTLLFYMLLDYKKKKNISNLKFIPLFIIMMFGQFTLYFFSGLYNYLAIILFAFAFYLDYEKKCKKKYCYPLYLLSVLMHSSMILPSVLLMLFKFSGNVINGKFIRRFVMGLLIIVFSFILLTDVLQVEAILHLKYVFMTYVIENTRMKNYYWGNILFMEILKAILSFTMFMYYSKIRKKQNEFTLFSVFLLLFVVITSPFFIMSIRFIPLILYICYVPLVDMFEDDNKYVHQVYYFACLIAIYLIIYNCLIMSEYGIFDVFTNHILSTPIDLYMVRGY